MGHQCNTERCCLPCHGCSLLKSEAKSSSLLRICAPSRAHVHVTWGTSTSPISPTGTTFRGSIDAECATRLSVASLESCDLADRGRRIVTRVDPRMDHVGPPTLSSCLKARPCRGTWTPTLSTLQRLAWMCTAREYEPVSMTKTFQ
jgi:hypothetical protein